MLSGIKEKILNVKKNVTLFGGEEKTSKNEKVNLNAGADILQHFQDQWVQMHDINEHNAKEADKLAEEIKNISTSVSNDKENLELMTHILSNSNLTTNITHCLNMIKNAHDLCGEVETGLINLENLIDEIEFDHMKFQHRYHLDQYKARKKEALDNLKVTLEEEHKHKITEHELNMKTVLEERQKVFQEAFKTDLELYKNLGTIPKVDLPKRQNGALLEEIQLDFDQNELDHFFNEK